MASVAERAKGSSPERVEDGPSLLMLGLQIVGRLGLILFNTRA